MVQCKALPPNLLSAFIHSFTLSAMIRLSLFLSLVYPAIMVVAQLGASSLTKHPNVLALTSPFNPVKAAYWTALPHHRRTPFAVGVSQFCYLREFCHYGEDPSLMLSLLQGLPGWSISVPRILG